MIPHYINNIVRQNSGSLQQMTDGLPYSISGEDYHYFATFPTNKDAFSFLAEMKPSKASLLGKVGRPFRVHFSL